MQQSNSSIVIDFFLPQVQARSRREILEIVADEMSAHLHVVRDDFLHDLLQQEQACPSGVGQKVAVMHLSVRGLFAARNMLLTLKNPVNFHASDNQAAEIFCLVLTPAQEGSLALPHVSRMTRALTNPAIQNNIREAKDIHDINSLFAETINLMKAA